MQDIVKKRPFSVNMLWNSSQKSITYSSLIYLYLAKVGILDLPMNLENDYCHNVSANQMISNFSKTFNEILRWKLLVILPTCYDENEFQKRQEMT